MALSVSPTEIVESGKYLLLVKHDTWERVPLGQVASVQNGFPFESKYFDRETGVPLVRIRDVTNAETEHRYTEAYDQDYLVNRGDILIGMDGDFKAARWKGNKGLLNQRVCRIALCSEYFDEDFLVLCLQPYLDAINAETSSVTVKHLSSRSVEQIPLPLPPLREQHRIVAKVEELFSELDKGVEALTAAREQFKGYRQSVLKHAFEGKLTEGWRKRRKEGTESPSERLDEIKKASDGYFVDQMSRWQIALQYWQRSGEKGKRPSKPERPTDVVPVSDAEIADLPTLPKSWSYVRLATLAQIGSGMSVSKDRVLDDPVEVPYLRVANVQRGGLDLTHIVKMRVEKSQLPQLVLKKWDVLFNEGGDRDKLGRGWVWEDQFNPCITQNHVFRASPYMASEAHAKFISYWGNTFGQDYFNTEGKQTTNLASINKAVLSSFPVPLPSMQEQSEIVNEIEERLSLADGLLSEIDAALERQRVLRQSILKQAFSGGLVGQDPRDEPAEALLERIRGGQRSATMKKERATKNGRKNAA